MEWLARDCHIGASPREVPLIISCTEKMSCTAVASLDETRSLRRAASEGLPKSIRRPLAKTTSVPSEGLPMFKHTFSRASSASACA